MTCNMTRGFVLDDGDVLGGQLGFIRFLPSTLYSINSIVDDNLVGHVGSGTLLKVFTTLEYYALSIDVGVV